MFYLIRHHDSWLVRLAGTGFFIGASLGMLSLVCYILSQTGGDVWFAFPLLLIGFVSFIVFLFSVAQTIATLFTHPGSSFWE